MIELNHTESYIKGFDFFKDRFEVDKKGNVKLLISGKITKGYEDKYGYLYVTLKKSNKRKNLKIHRAVASIYIPNSENKPCVNHINGIKTDNRIENLEWCTYSENMQHAVKHRLCTNSSKKGERHNTCKHTDKEIQEIRELYDKGGYTMRQIAKKFNTSSGYISDIVNLKIRN